jgi:hypothetical protein
LIDKGLLLAGEVGAIVQHQHVVSIDQFAVMMGHQTGKLSAKVIEAEGLATSGQPETSDILSDDPSLQLTDNDLIVDYDSSPYPQATPSTPPPDEGGGGSTPSPRSIHVLVRRA